MIAGGMPDPRAVLEAIPRPINRDVRARSEELPHKTGEDEWADRGFVGNDQRSHPLVPNSDIGYRGRRPGAVPGQLDVVILSCRVRVLPAYELERLHPLAREAVSRGHAIASPDELVERHSATVVIDVLNGVRV